MSVSSISRSGRLTVPVSSRRVAVPESSRREEPDVPRGSALAELGFAFLVLLGAVVATTAVVVVVGAAVDALTVAG